MQVLNQPHQQGQKASMRDIHTLPKPGGWAGSGSLSSKEVAQASGLDIEPGECWVSRCSGVRASGVSPGCQAAAVPLWECLFLSWSSTEPVEKVAMLKWHRVIQVTELAQCWLPIVCMIPPEYWLSISPIWIAWHQQGTLWRHFRFRDIWINVTHWVSEIQNLKSTMLQTAKPLKYHISARKVSVCGLGMFNLC